MWVGAALLVFKPETTGTGPEGRLRNSTCFLSQGSSLDDHLIHHPDKPDGASDLCITTSPQSPPHNVAGMATCAILLRCALLTDAGMRVAGHGTSSG
jgi:hypothetical protein